MLFIFIYSILFYFILEIVPCISLDKPTMQS